MNRLLENLSIFILTAFIFFFIGKDLYELKQPPFVISDEGGAFSIENQSRAWADQVINLARDKGNHPELMAEMLDYFKAVREGNHLGVIKSIQTIHAGWPTDLTELPWIQKLQRTKL